MMRNRSARLHLIATGPDYESEDVPPTVAAVASAQAVVDVYEATSREEGRFDIFPDYEGGIELKTLSATSVRTVEIDASGHLSARDHPRHGELRTLNYSVPDSRTAAAFLGVH